MTDLKANFVRAAVPAALALIAAPACAPAAAEVVAAAPNGFTISRSVTVPKPRAEAWEQLVHPAKWWSSDHTWSGDAKHMSISLRPGGCFCELWSKSGAQHAVVTYLAPGQELRMSGALGPMQTMGVAGAMVWSLEDAPEGTKVTWTYSVGGYSADPLDGLAPIVDGVLGEQIDRYAASLSQAN